MPLVLCIKSVVFIQHDMSAVLFSLLSGKIFSAAIKESNRLNTFTRRLRTHLTSLTTHNWLLNQLSISWVSWYTIWRV